MSYQCEKVLPYDEQRSKTEQVEQMFDNISDQYDTMNRAMTLGVDLVWRRKAIDSLRPFAPQRILDVATGTGDFAIESYRRLAPKEVVGVDLSEGMLQVGKLKVEKLGLSKQIILQQEDCLSMSFLDEQFDAVTVAFGVRNFSDLKAGIVEMNRVLRKGGHLVILEMSEPYKIFKPFYFLYTRFVIPFVGRLVSKDKRAYSYLPDSIKVFPHGDAMKNLLFESGFSSVEYRRFTFGVCAFYLAKK